MILFTKQAFGFIRNIDKVGLQDRIYVLKARGVHQTNLFCGRCQPLDRKYQISKELLTGIKQNRTIGGLLYR